MTNPDTCSKNMSGYVFFSLTGAFFLCLGRSTLIACSLLQCQQLAAHPTATCMSPSPSPPSAGSHTKASCSSTMSMLSCSVESSTETEIEVVSETMSSSSCLSSLPLTPGSGTFSTSDTMSYSDEDGSEPSVSLALRPISGDSLVYDYSVEWCCCCLCTGVMLALTGSAMYIGLHNENGAGGIYYTDGVPALLRGLGLF